MSKLLLNYYFNLQEAYINQCQNKTKRLIYKEQQQIIYNILLKKKLIINSIPYIK